MAAVALLAAGCGECAGTVECRVEPELSYSGQVIDHRTGAEVGHTRVAFVRDSGPAIGVDSVATVADARGYFTLRAGAASDGIVYGQLRVTAPSPYPPYTVPDLQLRTTRTRGDGAFLGRITAKPFLVLIGIVRDRKTQQLLGDVRVTIRRDSGGRLSDDSVTFTSDAYGQFSWYPDVLAPGTVNATFVIEAPGHPRTYRFARDISLLFRDGDESYQFLPVGMGLPYVGRTGRRGIGVPLPGTSVELTRVSGVATVPQQVTFPVDSYPNFPIALEPQAPGSLYVQLRILPPAPFAPEVRQLALATSDDDIITVLPWTGYGAHAGFSAELRDESGTLLPPLTWVRVRRVGGLPLEGRVYPPEGEYRATNTHGRIELDAATPDSGSVTFEVIVELPAPFMWDTVPGVTVPARYNDTIVDRGTLVVRKRLKP